MYGVLLLLSFILFFPWQHTSTSADSVPPAPYSHHRLLSVDITAYRNSCRTSSVNLVTYLLSKYANRLKHVFWWSRLCSGSLGAGKAQTIITLTFTLFPVSCIYVTYKNEVKIPKCQVSGAIGVNKNKNYLIIHTINWTRPQKNSSHRISVVVVSRPLSYSTIQYDT